jgi:hypothetical protein
MKHNDTGVRLEVLNTLKLIYDSRVKSFCEEALLDNDESVRLRAAFYLAAAEWLDLDAWLEQALNDPTYARYVAVRAVVGELESTWKTTKGSLPVFTYEQFLKNQHVYIEQYTQIIRAWQTWAVENPRFSQKFFEKARRSWQVTPDV